MTANLQVPLAHLSRADAAGVLQVVQPFAVLALSGLATWHGWAWYVDRLAASPEEGASLALTLAFFAILAVPRFAQRLPLRVVPLAPIAALLVAYSAAVVWAPPIFAAAMAVMMAMLILYLAVFGRWPPVAFWGLAALSLPVLPSLQFVLGYPMRLTSAVLTVALLDLQGMPISRQGTYVTVRGEMVQFDAPCSGVSMLWALMLITCMLAVLHRLDALRFGLALAAAVCMAIAANVLRVASLLAAEQADLAPAGSFAHEAIGLVAFAFAAAALMAGFRWWPTREAERWGL